MSRRYTTVLLTILLFTCLSTSIVHAAEIWVHPGGKGDWAKKEIGDWAVTRKGEATFSFAIPEDRGSVQYEAEIAVLIG